MKSTTPEALLERNRAWAKQIELSHPGLLDKLATGQSPRFLWIGCSDSRVPASGIVDLPPGELFVHRNVANVVAPEDPNGMSVLQYAVDVLRVPHVIVCGHYGCGGVQTSLGELPAGAIGNWLQHLLEVQRRNATLLESLEGDRKMSRLCELNVIEQVTNTAHTAVVKDAWARGQSLTLHGWIYQLADGRLRDLGVTMATAGEIERVREAAVDRPRSSDRQPC